MRSFEHFNPGHLAHLVVDAEQRHGLVLVSQPAQSRQAGGGRRFADDMEVSAEPPAEIIAKRAHHPSVVIDHEQHRLRHAQPPPQGQSLSTVMPPSETVRTASDVPRYLRRRWLAGPGRSNHAMISRRATAKRPLGAATA